ncbi:MAG: hypothetical protein D6780_04680, partial [Candidatus Dadabacteria bacterium]
MCNPYSAWQSSRAERNGTRERRPKRRPDRRKVPNNNGPVVKRDRESLDPYRYLQHPQPHTYYAPKREKGGVAVVWRNNKLYGAIMQRVVKLLVSEGVEIIPLPYDRNEQIKTSIRAKVLDLKETVFFVDKTVRLKWQKDKEIQKRPDKEIGGLDELIMQAAVSYIYRNTSLPSVPNVEVTEDMLDKENKSRETERRRAKNREEIQKYLEGKAKVLERFLRKAFRRRHYSEVVLVADRLANHLPLLAYYVPLLQTAKQVLDPNQEVVVTDFSNPQSTINAGRFSTEEERVLSEASRLIYGTEEVMQPYQYFISLLNDLNVNKVYVVFNWDSEKQRELARKGKGVLI